MSSALTMPEVTRIVADKASEFDRTVTPEFVHVFEDPHSIDGGKLIVQIAASRPGSTAEWTRRRLRLSQNIRDSLLARGDERYPLLSVFSREEWPGRNA